MAETPIEESTPRSEHHRRWILIACGAVAVLVVIAVLVRVVTWPGEPRPADAPLAELPSSVADLAANEQAILQSVENERRSVARAKLAEVRQAADTVLAGLDELEQEGQHWKSQVDSLLTNDIGKKLAANPQHLKAFDAMYRGRVPVQPFARNKRSLISVYMEPVDAALNGEAALFEPESTLLEQMRTDAAEVRKQLEQAREARGSIEALCRVADPTVQPQRLAPTLENALRQLEAGYAAEQAAQLAAVRDRVEQEYREQLAATEARKLKEINAAQLARREAELEGQRAAIESETKLIVTQERLKRLRKLAEDASIQAKYQPFLAKGTYVIGQRTGTGYQPTEPPQPVSYNTLVTANVFTDLKRFVSAGCGRGTRTRNDRPRWAYPQSEEDWEKYRAMFEEFRELAPIWLDMGLLAP